MPLPRPHSLHALVARLLVGQLLGGDTWTRKRLTRAHGASGLEDE